MSSPSTSLVRRRLPCSSLCLSRPGFSRPRRAPFPVSRRASSISPDAPQAYLAPLPFKWEVHLPEPARGRTQCLILDRKERKNALSVKMVNEMREAIAKVSADPRAQVLLVHSSEPAAFCSGADLAERRKMEPRQVSHFLDNLRAMFGDLEALSIPTIAYVDGYALGGGCELALCCDIRIGGKNTQMALPETKLGIIPGAGGTQRLTHLVGTAKAKEMIFTGRRLTGPEAQRVGLLNLYHPSTTTVYDAATPMITQILAAAPLALVAAKKAINAASYLQLSDGLDLERKLYNPLLVTEDRFEGINAFIDRRYPAFKGR